MHFMQQLQETASCGSSDETEAVARNAERTDKNREGADVQLDEHRLKLCLNRKPVSTVTAVYVNDIAVYLLADNQVLKNGIFSVRCSKPEASEYRNKRRLTVEHRANQANETLSLTYLKFTEWNTGEQKPSSPSDFRRLIS
ncbi:uncharacterized protein LOC127864631 [Dreissena polymorpha]|uniref:uncharacterized protein LOC127864631 n=1 Tax=Dreissena polymorpha TaxID=45954 RepID=UPI0022640ABA|nr:uncharacterized protein LOC127864631 [Dreissena polymorpha]